MAGKANTPATRETSDIAEASPVRQMLSQMAQVATADENEGRFSGDDLNAILTAETEQDVWEADDRPPLNFQHLAGCDLEILDFQVKYSRNANTDIQTPFIAADGRKMYLLCNVVRVSNAGAKQKIIRLPEPGEVFTANTSARFVVAKLWRMYQLGKIDPDKRRTLRCVVQEIDLGGDQAVIKLRPPTPAPATASVA